MYLLHETPRKLVNPSLISDIVKSKCKNGINNLSFYKLHSENRRHIIDNVIISAFIEDENYKYLFPNINDRATAIKSRFSKLIPSMTNINTKIENSFVLKHDDINNEIGHVLLHPPNDTESNESILDYLCVNHLPFTRTNKINTMIKMLSLRNVMNHEYFWINKIMNDNNDNNGYWEISCVCTDPKVQSYGYGSIMMNNIHNVIQTNQCYYDYNVPIILFTSTPNAYKFYCKLGYKPIMATSIIKANENQITSNALIYHHDESVLNEWIKIFNHQIPKYHHKINQFSFMSSKYQSHHTQCNINNDYYFDYF